MKNFVFNNISSDSLELIIKDMPYVPSAKKDIETITVPGRNGNLHIDNDCYLSKDYTIVCIVKNKQKIDNICSCLKGNGKLNLSIYPDRYFEATILNQINFSKYLNYLEEFPLQLELNPIAYSNEETTEEIITSRNIVVGGNAYVFPIVKIFGIGNVTINGYSLQTLESDITIDCELQNCFNELINKNNKVVLDEFPRLNPGENQITLGTGITKIIIKYRKGWL